MTEQNREHMDRPEDDKPRRPGDLGAAARQRPGPSPDSGHPTGPHAPFDEDAGRAAERVRQDAAGQYRPGMSDPNPDGLVSANPVVLSKDGDATSGNGHGRDRDGSKTPQD